MKHHDLEDAAKRICVENELEFVKSVGEGSFKQTFHARDPDGTSCALKLYKAANFGKRDQREILAMLKCDHPNIARLLRVDKTVLDGQELWWMIEEFLPGGSLTDKAAVSTQECLSIGKQLIEAVCHIADQGLVHRDIKPDNVMFRQDGVTPVLTDFGVARDLLDSSITPTWAPRGPGTPFFSSPEQLNNQKHLTDWRCDQFTLGVVLAYVTFGRHPYAADSSTDREVVENVSMRKGPSVSFVRKTTAAGLPVLAKMVMPWPIDRYRKPGQLLAAWNHQQG